MSASLSAESFDDDATLTDQLKAKKTTLGRRKIEINYIEDKNKRGISFSKRKAGIMKKAFELSILTGVQVLLLVVSETGCVYSFSTPKLEPVIALPEGRRLIHHYLTGKPQEESEPRLKENDNVRKRHLDEDDKSVKSSPFHIFDMGSSNRPAEIIPTAIPESNYLLDSQSSSSNDTPHSLNVDHLQESADIRNTRRCINSPQSSTSR